MQAKSKPLFNFIFVLIFLSFSFRVVAGLIDVGVWKHMLVFGNTCWCLETHVGVRKHMFVL